MSTSTLQNFRVGSDLTVKVRLKDGGVAIDWSTLSGIRAVLYSDAQSSIAGRCDVTVDGEDPTLLVCRYAATKMQYLGVNRIVVSAKYMGMTKTYDKPVFTFVRWTADQEGEQITIEDPEVTVEIEVQDVTSSILQEAVDAALSAAEKAEEAAALVPLQVLQDCVEATEDANEAAEAANAAGITSVEASIADNEPGTPSVEATMLNKILTLVFHHLKGVKGDTGATPNITVGTVTTGEPGTAVVVTMTGTAESPVLNITIPQGLKGAQGNTGSSVDYPFELVNNLTTDDATKALSAAQGVVLDGKISQLQQKVGDFGMSNIPLTGNWASGTLTGSGSYAADSRRIICSIDLVGKVGLTFRATAESGYDVGVHFMAETYKPDAHDISGQTILWQSGWSDSVVQSIPNGTQSVVILLRKDDNADLTTSDSSKVSLSYEGYVSLAERTDALQGEIDKINVAKNETLSHINWAIGSLTGTGNYAEDSRRLICSINLAGLNGATFIVSAGTGYDARIHFSRTQYSEDPTTINGISIDFDSGWTNNYSGAIPNLINSAVLLFRKTDNSDLALSDLEKISVSLSLTNINNRVAEIENTMKSASGLLSGDYFGQELSLGDKRRKFNLDKYGVFNTTRYAQSLAIYGDYIVFFYGGGGHEGSIWRISDETKLGDISFPYTGNEPHGNTLSFGVEFATGNTDLPLLYLSECFNDGRCLVYDLHLNGTITLVQTISANIGADIFGSPLGDWVIDKDSRSLFSVRYHINSYTAAEGNYVNICRFRLPSLSEGEEITLLENDVLDFFTSPFFAYSQDKSIYGGLLYIGAGNENASAKQQVIVLSTTDGHIVAKIDLHGYNNEPEGLEVIEDGLVIGYGYDYTQYYLLTT